MMSSKDRTTRQHVKMFTITVDLLRAFFVNIDETNAHAKLVPDSSFQRHASKVVTIRAGD